MTDNEELKEKIAEADKTLKNSKEIPVKMLEFLLTQKDKSISFAAVASLLTEGFSSFEKDFEKNDDDKYGFSKAKLADKPAEYVFHLTVYGLYTKMISYFLYLCSPEEAQKIKELWTNTKKDV